MDRLTLAAHQQALAERPSSAHIFLEGPAGAGKTTAGVARLMALLGRGHPGGSCLVLVPQRALAEPYRMALQSVDLPPGGRAATLTIGGLARRLVELFWPLAAPAAGFVHPGQPPRFLTLETAQYHLAKVVEPMLAEGRFRSVTLERPRLYRQILDSLNKSAAVGFPMQAIGERLSGAWLGDPAQERLFADVQIAAAGFRDHCRAHNLLDFSFQLEVFWRHLWPEPACRAYLTSTVRHLIADNLEEDVPVCHDLIASWLPELESALLIVDQAGGLRRFLGADPESAHALKARCPEAVIFSEAMTPAPPGLAALGEALGGALDQLEAEPARDRSRGPAPDDAVRWAGRHFLPEMLDQASALVVRLVQAEQVPPGQIAVLAPYLGDALRQDLLERLARAGIPARSLRPSRPLRADPAIRCLLTLAEIAHPGWGRLPDRFDVAAALRQALAGLDPVRADLLARVVYSQPGGAVRLAPFGPIIPLMKARLTARAGGRYEDLRVWLEAYQQGPAAELDVFWSRLFHDLLVRPGYGFHDNPDAGAAAARLIESFRKFQLAVGQGPAADPALGREYVQLVSDGVLAAQFVEPGSERPAEAVLVAPAYTFLMRNQPVDVQLWLAVGDPGWFDRPDQPLTHPYVLSRQWPAGRPWTDADEDAASRAALYRLGLGLLRRCRRAVYLMACELNEHGSEQRGGLLLALERAFRRLGSRPAEAVP